MAGLLLQYGIENYFNGHTHALKHYRLDGVDSTDWFTSGAGCMVYTHDHDELEDPKQDVNNTHKLEELFYKKVSGFTSHTFSSDFSTLTSNVLDTDGNVLYTFTTKKQSGSKRAAAIEEKFTKVVV